MAPAFLFSAGKYLQALPGYSQARQMTPDCRQSGVIVYLRDSP
jgi:hypothetical protein